MSWRRVHATLTIVWALLVIPSLVFWSTQLPWLVFMSVYACVMGHWSSYQACRAEDQQSEST